MSGIVRSIHVTCFYLEMIHYESSLKITKEDLNGPCYTTNMSFDHVDSKKMSKSKDFY